MKKEVALKFLAFFLCIGTLDAFLQRTSHSTCEKNFTTSSGSVSASDFSGENCSSHEIHITAGVNITVACQELNLISGSQEYCLEYEDEGSSTDGQSHRHKRDQEIENAEKKPASLTARLKGAIEGKIVRTGEKLGRLKRSNNGMDAEKSNVGKTGKRGNRKKGGPKKLEKLRKREQKLKNKIKKLTKKMKKLEKKGKTQKASKINSTITATEGKLQKCEDSIREYENGNDDDGEDVVDDDDDDEDNDDGDDVPPVCGSETVFTTQTSSSAGNVELEVSPAKGQSGSAISVPIPSAISYTCTWSPA